MNGVNNRVGENGALLWRQIQRIGVKSFILNHLLILDEATNALDVDTEKNLLKHYLKKLQEKITIISISILKTVH